MLDGGPVALQLEQRRRGVGQLGAQQQLEGGVGGLEGPAVGLQHLDPVDDPADDVGVPVEVDAELAALELHRRPAGHLGDQDAHVVAHDLRVEVVVQLGADLDRAGVQAGLVRERRGADVGLVLVGGDVGELGDGVADPLQLGQAALRHDRQAHLGDQVGDQREGVGVAGALAVAVRRPLDVGDAGLDGGQGVGDGAAGVVLAVDAQPALDPRADVGDDPAHAHRQHAAVGVAQDADLGPGRERRPQHVDAVVGVGGVPVEEVLAVDEHPPAVRHEERHGVAHHGQVLLERGPQRLAHVPDVGLGDQADHRRLGVQQRAHLGVVRHADAGLAGGPERDQLGVPQLELGAGAGEELGVLGQGAGPAALDEADPDLVEQPGDGQLVGDGVADPLALGAVAQRGVEDVEVGAGRSRHGVLRGEGATAPDTKKTPRQREVCARSGGVDCALGDEDRAGAGHLP